MVRNTVMFVICSVCHTILVIGGNTNMTLMCRAACATVSTVPVRAPGKTAKDLAYHSALLDDMAGCEQEVCVMCLHQQKVRTARLPPLGLLKEKWKMWLDFFPPPWHGG